MATQTKTQIERMLSSASRWEYKGLYWYVEAKSPGNVHTFAAYPGRYIPVIRVGPDLDESRGLATWLLMTIQSFALPILELSIGVTTEDRLNDVKKWWIWGEPLCFDAICYACGEVIKTHYSVAGDGFMCSSCSMNYEPCCKGNYDRRTI